MSQLTAESNFDFSKEPSPCSVDHSPSNTEFALLSLQYDLTDKNVFLRICPSTKHAETDKTVVLIHSILSLYSSSKHYAWVNNT